MISRFLFNFSTYRPSFRHSLWQFPNHASIFSMSLPIHLHCKVHVHQRISKCLRLLFRTMSLTYRICPTRHRRSKQEDFYVLDTVTLFQPYPTISLIDNTGTLYDVHFCPSVVTCSCPDDAVPCKHMIFLFTFLGFNPFPGQFTLDLTRCLTTIRQARPFHYNRLDVRANQLCTMFIYRQCARCNQPTTFCDLYVCNQCDHLIHQSHLPPRLPRCCPLCKQPWKPHTSSSTKDGYRNFYSLLKFLGYKVTKGRGHSPPPTCNVVPRTP